MTVKTSSLWDIAEKQTALIEDLDHSLEICLSTRLKETGFDFGQSVTCLKKLPLNGPRLYQVADSVFSIEKSVAEKIYIKEAK